MSGNKVENSRCESRSSWPTGFYKRTGILIALAWALTFCICACDKQDNEAQLVEKAEAAIKERKYKTAYGLLKQVTQKDSKNGRTYFLKAFIDERYRRFDNAIWDFTKAISLNYEPTFCQFKRAWLFHRKGELWRARSDYHFVLRKSEKKYAGHLYTNLSDIALRLGDDEKCKMYIEQALQADSKSAAAYANRSDLEFAEGELDNALKDIDKVIELLSEMKFGQEHDLEADFKTYSHALKAEILDKLGREEEGQNERELARESYKKYLRFLMKNYKYTSDQFRERFKNRVQSPHLVLCSDLPPDRISEFEKQGNDFIDFLDAKYCRVNKSFKPTVVIFETKKDFLSFGKDVANFKRSKCRGIQFPYWMMSAVYDGAEDSPMQLKHQLVHNIMAEHFVLPEKWAKEGLAEMFAVSSVPGKDGLSLDLTKSCEYLKKRYKREHNSDYVNLTVNLSTTIPNPRKVHEYHLMAVFLAENGNLKKYFELAKLGYRKGYPTLYEAAFDKPLMELEPIWRDFKERVLSSLQPSKK